MKNEVYFIPLGELHRLSNPKNIPLEIIEVQSGEYLGEDDIERIEKLSKFNLKGKIALITGVTGKMGLIYPNFY